MKLPDLSHEQRAWFVRELARRDFRTFLEAAFRELNPAQPFVASGHIDVIADHLERCRRGEIRRLIINLPPRSLKSHCASVSFPAWLLGHHASRHVICVSYGQDLAEKFARDCRRVMESAWFKDLFPTRLDTLAARDFKTTAEGTRLATSVGGTLTGRGGDVIIVDDPMKGDDALSATERSRVIEWYEGSLLSRLNNKDTGVIIIVMQRLHQDDLVGHLLEQEKDRWTVLSFPSVAIEEETFNVDTLLGRAQYRRMPGDLLNPGMDSNAALDAIKTSVGSFTFQSQYQQQPMPEGGGVIQTSWLLYYGPDERPERFEMVLQSWDTANKPGELNDFSVCTTWGIWKRRYYLLDVYRKKLDFPALKKAARAQAAKHSPRKILIEDKASGVQLIQELKSEGMAGVTAYTPPPHMDKTMRLHEQSVAFESGEVLLPKSAAWLADYVAEMTGFPGTKYKDQVDSTSQALAFIRPSGLSIWVRLGERA